MRSVFEGMRCEPYSSIDTYTFAFMFEMHHDQI